jgi:uncharacterized integral membrane protein
MKNPFSKNSSSDNADDKNFKNTTFKNNLVKMKNGIRTFLIVLLLLIVVIFAASNTQMVILQLFFWKINGSLSLFLILSFLIGWVIGILSPFPKKKIKP